MRTIHTPSFKWQIACAVLLMAVSVLMVVVFELKLRLADADQTSMRMCYALGRLVAHTRLPKQYIYTEPVGDFIERGAYRRNWDIPILDRPHHADMFRKIFERSRDSEQRRMSNQNQPSEVREGAPN